MIVIINELGDSFVMASSKHPRRSLFWGELFDVYWLVGCVGRVASNHLFVLSNSDTFAPESLNVFQTRQDFVLDDEGGLHLVS